MALQHIIHYKIAGYGSATSYANNLGLLDEAAILHTCLNAEKEFDRKLANLAESVINLRAVVA